ncbi:pilus assembly protein TadG-related protein [Nocardioides sp. Soil796]|uniref:pilus assembly protein TadG-related protein n=1 Tax=Nocardioides sp. Soil796 TaxID=1736412 RepID=UPI00070A6BA5|nr:pilus assembly protein TadG-related protein [Nocardioides sp. Soil796]KRF17538.1 hypothetical protein ASH02_25070 [Nocardioides sp. Soil796]
MKRRDDDGQVTVLIVGFAIVLVLAVGLVVDASAAYLQRQGLDNVADGAALAGADEIRGTAVYDGGLKGERAPLDARAAHAAVGAYLREIGAYGDYPALTYVVHVRDNAVVVNVSAGLDLPITVGSLSETRVGSRGSAVVDVQE